MQHDLPFDPTYGHDLDALLKVGTPLGPDDFADFWRDLHARTLAVPPRPATRDVATGEMAMGSSDARTFEVEFDSLDGFRVGGWLTVPTGGRPARGLVVGHGYGGRAAPDYDVTTTPVAAIFPCARGFNRSARPDLPTEAGTHVLHGIESRDTYVHGRCAADLWAAASALLELFPDVEGHLDYSGTSFGGGMGALAIPWERRLRRAFLDVPSFGNHPLRLSMRCQGSGEFVRHRYRSSPEVVDVLRYFDAATAAGHIRIPTMVGAALFDPAVPPPGQFAVYNALRGHKSLFVHQAGHFPHTGEAAECATMMRRVAAWFEAPNVERIV